MQNIVDDVSLRLTAAGLTPFRQRCTRTQSLYWMRSATVHWGGGVVPFTADWGAGGVSFVSCPGPVQGEPRSQTPFQHFLGVIERFSNFNLISLIQATWPIQEHERQMNRQKTADRKNSTTQKHTKTCGEGRKRDG